MYDYGIYDIKNFSIVIDIIFLSSNHIYENCYWDEQNYINAKNEHYN